MTLRTPSDPLPTYLDKASELVGLAQAQHVPPWVSEAILGLAQDPRKLVCMNGYAKGTLGARRFLLSLCASDLLCELTEAVRALDWLKVRVLAHAA